MTGSENSGSNWDKWAEELGVSSSQQDHPANLGPIGAGGRGGDINALAKAEDACGGEGQGEARAPDDGPHGMKVQLEVDGQSGAPVAETGEKPRRFSDKPAIASGNPRFEQSHRSEKSHRRGGIGPAKSGSESIGSGAQPQTGFPADDKSSGLREGSQTDTGRGGTAPGISATAPKSGKRKSENVTSPKKVGWTPPRKRIWPDFSGRQRSQTDWDRLAVELGIASSEEKDLEREQTQSIPEQGDVPHENSAEDGLTDVADGSRVGQALQGGSVRDPEGAEAPSASGTQGESQEESLGVVTEFATGRRGVLESVWVTKPPANEAEASRPGSLKREDTFGDEEVSAPSPTMIPGVREEAGQVIGTVAPVPETLVPQETAGPVVPESIGGATPAEIRVPSLPEAAHVDFALGPGLIASSADTATAETREDSAKGFSREALTPLVELGSGGIAESISADVGSGALRGEVLLSAPSSEGTEPTSVFYSGPPESGVQVAVSEETSSPLAREEAFEISQESGQSAGEISQEETARQEGEALEEEIPPAFRAWFELFGEEPPELLSRREEKWVRELLGAPSLSEEKAAEVPPAESSSQAGSLEAITALAVAQDVSEWVSSAEVSWVGEEVSPEPGQPPKVASREAGSDMPGGKLGAKSRRGRKRRRRASDSPSRKDTTVDADQESPEKPGDEDATDGVEKDDQPHLIPSEAIPTWEETVGLVIAANMEHRSRAHHSHPTHPRRSQRN